VQIGGDRTARDLRTSRRRRPCVVRRGRLEDRGRIRTLRERGVVDRRETRLGRSPPACHRCRNLRRLDIRVRHTFLTPRVGPGGFPYGARRDRVPAHSSRSVMLCTFPSRVRAEGRLSGGWRMATSSSLTRVPVHATCYRRRSRTWTAAATGSRIASQHNRTGGRLTTPHDRPGGSTTQEIQVGREYPSEGWRHRSSRACERRPPHRHWPPLAGPLVERLGRHPLSSLEGGRSTALR